MILQKQMSPVLEEDDIVENTALEKDAAKSGSDSSVSKKEEQCYAESDGEMSPGNERKEEATSFDDGLKDDFEVEIEDVDKIEAKVD